MKFFILTLIFLTLTACKGPAGANGQNGAQGPAGQDAPPTPYTPVGLVNPCGDAPGIADEVFIEMANGTLVASYGTGNSVRFAVLTPGSYITTDGDNCTFTINANGELENESH